MDLAELGFRVDATGVVRATRNLKDMEEAAGRTERASDRMSKRTESVARVMTRMAAVGGAALTALVANSIRLGVEAEETASKFQVVFRGSVERTDKALQDLQKTIPLTTSEMRAFAAAAQDMLVPLGIARDQAADMSVEIVRLAGDISAFNNVSTDQVLQNIQSALAGEAQVLRKYGIAMNEARLKQVAFDKGITESVRQLTFAERAMAALEVITLDTADAMGFAAAEMNSTQGKLRQLSRDFKQFQEDLGAALIPTFNQFLSILTDVDEDGLTPMQTALNSVAVAILRTTQTIVLASMQFMHLKHAVTSTVDDINTAVRTLPGHIPGVGLVQEFLFGPEGDGSALGDAVKDAATQALNPLSLITDYFSTSIDEQKAKLAELGASGEEATDPFLKSMQDMLKVVEDLETKIGEFASGKVKRGLGEADKGVTEIAKTVTGTLIPALKTLNQDVLREMQDGFAFLQEIHFDGMVSAMEAEIAALEGGAEAWREYERAMFQAQAVAELGPDATQEQIDKITELSGRLFDARDAFGETAEAARGIGDAMMEGGEIMRDVFRDLQRGMNRESDAYKKLTVAIEAANVVRGIGAVIKQLSEGDVYSAIPRAAAVAAAVASLGVAIGNLSGYTDPTADRQAANGTGTVLGDAEAKSESIANAVEITANATSKLVGINTGMLRALNNLTNAITGASTLLARGAAELDFGDLPVVELFGSDALGEILGGSVSIADTGIRVEGGTLAELIEGTLISAYQEIAEKKHWFDDTDISRTTIPLGEELQNQFGDIFGALVDTVIEAGQTIGYSMDLIQGRLDEFEVYARDISFEDMNAEEQQEALEAFFSSIFDDMSLSTIPGLREMQKVGEGAGETLVRVATSVQVFELALEQLGFGFIEFNASMWRNMDDFVYRTTFWKVALVEAVGGLDAFIDGFTTFFEAFASEEQKLEYLFSSLTMRFAEVGLELPETRDGMWDLMQSLDATTEAGREQIATLLKMADTADAYYKAAEKAAAEAAKLAEKQAEAIYSFIGGAPAAFKTLTQRFTEALKAADALGSGTKEVGLIFTNFGRQMRRMTAEMTRDIITMSQSLFSQDDTQNALDNIGEVQRVSNSLFTEWQRALTDLKGYADSLLLDDSLTTLTPAQQLAEAQRQFDSTLAAARGGDLDAANNLPDAARELLDNARFMFASGTQYDRIFRQVQQALRGVEMPKGIEEYTVEIADNTLRTATAVEAMQNETLSEIERYLQAMDLAESLRDLAYVLDEPVEDLAARLGVPLDRLTEILGVDSAILTEGITEEIDLLASIDAHLEFIRDSLTGSTGSSEGGKNGITYTNPVVSDSQSPTLTLGDNNITSGQADQIITLLTDIRDNEEESARDSKAKGEQTVGAIDSLNETLRRQIA